MGSQSTPASLTSSPVHSGHVPIGGFVQNARKAFESITQKDANHFSDVTLSIANVEEGRAGREDGSPEESDVISEQNFGQPTTVNFYCHRYLLAQGSPVFGAMFR